MKKIFCTVLITLLFLSCLAGCSGGLRLDSKKPVTLTMWHNYGGDMQETMDLLIDEFNGTVGREHGIVINVTAISSSAELEKSLNMIANGDPGAPDMPDIFTGYPKTAIHFYEQDMLVNFKDYFTEEELSQYVDAFVEEGVLEDRGLYVFPIAKSTEILYVNQTLFDRFADETGADLSGLATFEGLAGLSEMYYNWTDAQTPAIEGDGRQFFAADSWFNVAAVGMAQLGDSIFEDNSRLTLEGEAYAHIFNTIYAPAVRGGVAIYDGYSSDLSKTGDIVCSTGSSAGILFYGDTITYSDGTVEDVEYAMMPYPVFEGGSKIALQRGGGLMVAKSDEHREQAACIFIKWLTQPKQNMKFISETGYLPVTKQALNNMSGQIDSFEDERIHKMLTAVLSMYDEYVFFTAPNYSDFEADSDGYEAAYKALLTKNREKYLMGEPVSASNALAQMHS